MDRHNCQRIFSVIFLGSAVVDSRVPVSMPLQFQNADLLRKMAQLGYAGVKGTWTIEGQKSAFPIQTSEIDCLRDDRVCRAATATIGTGFGPPVLMVDQDSYAIANWTQDQIVFTDDQPTCASYRYTIDLVTGRTSGVRERKKSSDPNCIKLEERLVLNLSNGSELTQKLRSEAEPLFLKLALLPFAIWR